jgi:hypothetical protein
LEQSADKQTKSKSMPAEGGDEPLPQPLNNFFSSFPLFKPALADRPLLSARLPARSIIY